MIVTVEQGADPRAVERELAARGLWVRRFEDGAHVQFLVEDHSSSVDGASVRRIAGVAGVAERPSAHPRVDAQPAVIDVAGLPLGPDAHPIVMAGPCAVESAEQIRDQAQGLAAAGASVLRGGAYKPRTSPYSFQGHGRVALEWLRRAADDAGLRVVTEALAPEDVPAVAEAADLVQIGSRNMHCSALLRAAGRAGKPVLLKRGMAATVEEWLLAAEYCLCHGAPAVILCERGVRGFDPSTRNLLDLAAVALLAGVRRLPVVVDPSHATGRREIVAPLARAAIAAGACGLLLEAHPDPGAALCDGPQALSLAAVAEIAGALPLPRAARRAAGG